MKNVIEVYISKEISDMFGKRLKETLIEMSKELTQGYKGAVDSNIASYTRTDEFTHKMTVTLGVEVEAPVEVASDN